MAERGYGETAGAAITQFALVYDNAGSVEETTGATVRPIGVAQQGADSGEKFDTIVEGKTKVIAGAAISKGAILQPAAAGKVITNDGATASRFLVGEALEAASADGDIIEVYFKANYTAV